MVTCNFWGAVKLLEICTVDKINSGKAPPPPKLECYWILRCHSCDFSYGKITCNTTGRCQPHRPGKSPPGWVQNWLCRCAPTTCSDCFVGSDPKRTGVFFINRRGRCLVIWRACPERAHHPTGRHDPSYGLRPCQFALPGNSTYPEKL